MINQETKKESIKQTLEDYAKAYCAKDINAMMQVFDDTDNISVIGTGASELCVGRDQVRVLFLNNFDEATATKFEWDWIDIRISDDHAVVSVTLTIHLIYKGEDLQVPIRWTVVLKNKNNRWVWIHRNASAAASSQEEGQAYPANTK
ncbi:MAG: nuclear transport factor 2 family protein [Urechidicola sp.]|nr:nuclear transport factor 2 family protein [Urechidicola sp.]